MSSQAAVTADNSRAAVLMIGAMAGFAVEDAFLKRGAGAMPPGLVILLVGLMGTAVLWAIARAKGVPVFTLQALRGRMLVRNLGEAGTAVFFMAGIVNAPLSFASALIQALPLCITAGAALFLGETVGWRRWLSILVGFAGVLVILQPWQASPTLISGLLMLGAVGCMAVRDLVTRGMSAEISSLSVSAWGFGSMAVGGLTLTLLRGDPLYLPPAPELGILVISVAFGLVGYTLLTVAMRMGEVSVIAPFRYMRLVFVLLIALIFFGEKLELHVVIGIAMVVGSGLYAFARARLKARTRN